MKKIIISLILSFILVNGAFADEIKFNTSEIKNKYTNIDGDIEITSDKKHYFFFAINKEGKKVFVFDGNEIDINKYNFGNSNHKQFIQFFDNYRKIRYKEICDEKDIYSNSNKQRYGELSLIDGKNIFQGECHYKIRFIDRNIGPNKNLHSFSNNDIQFIYLEKNHQKDLMKKDYNEYWYFNGISSKGYNNINYGYSNYGKNNKIIKIGNDFYSIGYNYIDTIVNASILKNGKETGTMLKGHLMKGSLEKYVNGEPICYKGIVNSYKGLFSLNIDNTSKILMNEKYNFDGDKYSINEIYNKLEDYYRICGDMENLFFLKYKGYIYYKVKKGDKVYLYQNKKMIYDLTGLNNFSYNNGFITFFNSKKREKTFLLLKNDGNIVEYNKVNIYSKNMNKTGLIDLGFRDNTERLYIYDGNIIDKYTSVQKSFIVGNNNLLVLGKKDNKQNIYINGKLYDKNIQSIDYIIRTNIGEGKNKYIFEGIKGNKEIKGEIDIYNIKNKKIIIKKENNNPIIKNKKTNPKLDKVLNKFFNKIDKKGSDKANIIYKKVLNKIDAIIKKTKKAKTIELLNYIKEKIEIKLN